ncbi:MAG: hypothetical protein U0795_25585 [Pirellulales bacterium]
MGYDYRKNIQPVGQNDRNACWAASISWWLNAYSLHFKRRWLTQNDLLAKFTDKCLDDGSLPISQLRSVCESAEVRIDLAYMSPAKFRSDYETIDGPLLIVFNYPTVGGTHMNVIFDRQGGTVMAMEPYFPFPGRDGQRTGKYERRDLTFYANSTEIGIGRLPLADAFYQQQ